jgi:hypothetical protein
MRAALSAFSRGDYETYCSWITKQNRVRTTTQENTMSDHTPPDPYEKALAALRAKAAATRPAALRPTDFPTDGTPPDPYKAGLERLRQEENR